MKSYITNGIVLILLGVLSIPALADDEEETREGARKSGDESAAVGTLRTKEDDAEEAGLLLPAVQKVRAAAGKSESAKPGVEPDEIDAKASSERSGGYMKIGDIKGESEASGATKPGGSATGQSRRRGQASLEDVSVTKEMDKSSPKLQEASVGGSRYSTQQMMMKLRPRTNTLVASGQGGNASPSDKVAQPGQSQAYEIAECGTATNPMICCHHEAGDGSTCNMFQMLCENAGGTAQGDQTDATCSDWP
jgi:hypothetical protein